MVKILGRKLRDANFGTQVSGRKFRDAGCGKPDFETGMGTGMGNCNSQELFLIHLSNFSSATEPSSLAYPISLGHCSCFLTSWTLTRRVNCVIIV